MRALNVDVFEERVVVQSRLKNLYTELGMNKEADDIVIDEYEKFDGEVTLNVPLSEIGNYAKICDTEINKAVRELFSNSYKNVNRNDLCPCASGKKHKNVVINRYFKIT